eukprot:scaffold484501_cov46-Prasinocladus_malaysianus.AAC.1
MRIPHRPYRYRTRYSYEYEYQLPTPCPYVTRTRTSQQTPYSDPRTLLAGPQGKGPAAALLTPHATHLRRAGSRNQAQRGNEEKPPAHSSDVHHSAESGHYAMF